MPNEKRSWLLAEKAYHLIQQKRMKDVDKASLQKTLGEKLEEKDFNLYRFVLAFLETGERP
ncbi:MAG: hypothetical protein EOO14_19125 [Chitinophagaceae bacterium]|nr:MAG: hypothetical protein EOO14_19125 [Chitinophagaceae bacterium]